MRDSNLKAIYRLLSDHPVCYHPHLAKLVGSIKGAIVLNQLLYWSDKGSLPNGWIFKTIDELQQETGLTRAEQQVGIRKCKELGVLKVKLRGIPAKRHFKLDIEYLMALIAVETENLPQYGNFDAQQFALYKQRITDNTQRETHNSTQKHSSKVWNKCERKIKNAKIKKTREALAKSKSVRK